MATSSSDESDSSADEPVFETAAVTKPSAPRPKKIRFPVIKQIRKQEEEEEKDLVSYVKSEAKPITISFVAHVVLFVLLSFVVMSKGTGGGVGGGGMEWFSPVIGAPDGGMGSGESGAGTGPGAGEGPISITTVVSSVPGSGGGTPDGATTAGEGAGTVKGAGSGPPGGVKPAGAGGKLGGRGARFRNGMLQDAAGDRRDTVRSCIDRGMSWLVRQQKAGGNWKLHEGYPDPADRILRTDTGATALALLALLGDGNTQVEGPHKDAVRKGLSWLKSIQKKDGDYHDHEELGRETAFYAHSQALIAICEAYALTGDPSLRESADRGLAFLLASQHPIDGGWRYQPQDRESMGDLSVTGWCLMAMNTARMANIEVPLEPFNRVSIFVDSVESQNGARYRYLPNYPASRATNAMTAEGLLCRQWLGWPKGWPAMLDGVKTLRNPDSAPEWAVGRRNVYEWYYAAQVLHNLGGDDWKQWYGRVQYLLVENQVKAGSRKAGEDIVGSWNPYVSQRGGDKQYGVKEEQAERAGRHYITALCLLILETPYRHTPIYDEEPAK